MNRILVVEDDASIAKIEQDFLSISGYEVNVVTDGEQGLQPANKKSSSF